jgi:N-methylhydantoinase B
MGARAAKTGLSATCFPAGVSAVPVEILEAAMPIVFHRKELRKGSGGAGAQRGGDGQIIAFSMRTDQPWVLNASPVCLIEGPEDLRAADPASPAVALSTASLFQNSAR